MLIANPAPTISPLVVFGKNLRTHREAAGLSQEAFANTVGLHRTYISSVERGQRNVGLENICKIARALDIPPRQLMEGMS